MTEVTFIQYLRPDGRRRQAIIDRTEEIARMALELQQAGYELAIEELMTGALSMTVESKDEDQLEEEGTLAHEICLNGPPVLAAVDKLITTAHGKLNDKLCACETEGEARRENCRHDPDDARDSGIPKEGM